MELMSRLVGAIAAELLRYAGGTTPETMLIE